MTEQGWVILQREQELAQEEQKRECAWCLVEEGLDLGEGSHGICDEHAAQVIANLHTARENRGNR